MAALAGWVVLTPMRPPNDSGLRVVVDDSDTCATVRETLERMGDKWTLLVVRGLSEGPQRFNALQRTAYPEVPPRAEYSLTPLGGSFVGPAMGVTQWVLDADEEIRRNRAEFDLLSR